MDQRLELLRSLAVENQTKMVLLVLDGLGGLPSESGMTELEKAITPNLDEMAAHGETGLLEIVDTGITPGSGPGHLALFGYDPLRYRIGRGILETLGVGAEVEKGEVCARGNFCTWRDGDIIDDRRAGRIPTPESAEIVEVLSRSIKKIEDVDVRFYSGMEHRFAVVFSGEYLSEKVADADPQQEGRPMKWARAFDSSGEKTARIANALIRRVHEVLGDQPKANGCLLRGFSGVPDIPAMPDLYSMKAAAVASYPMYRGLARLVGMDVLEVGKTIKELFNTVVAFWDAYDYFYVHVKYT
ncbi:MAG: phosphoglycerate mutase, partial [Synergistota bacterium]|nr:phosphoglycerate mutase [Synergistota bacterium]